MIWTSFWWVFAVWLVAQPVASPPQAQAQAQTAVSPLAPPPEAAKAAAATAAKAAKAATAKVPNLPPKEEHAPGPAREAEKQAHDAKLKSEMHVVWSLGIGS